MSVAVEQARGRSAQDHISRGLYNTTVLTSSLRQIQTDADEQMTKATREYNRAIEEIALKEREVNERASSVFNRLWAWMKGQTQLFLDRMNRK